MDLLNKLVALLPIVIPAVVAFNVILGGVGQLLEALKQNNAAGVVGKVASFLKKVLDLAQGNLPH